MSIFLSQLMNSNPQGHIQSGDDGSNPEQEAKPSTGKRRSKQDPKTNNKKSRPLKGNGDPKKSRPLKGNGDGVIGNRNPDGTPKQKIMVEVDYDKNSPPADPIMVRKDALEKSPPKPTPADTNVGRPPVGSKGNVGQSYQGATERKPDIMPAEEYNTYVGEGKGAAPGTKVQIAPQQGSKNKPKPTAPATEKPKFVPRPSTPEELERGRRLTREAYKRSLQNKGRSLDPRTEAYRRQNAGKGINDYGSAAAPQRRKSDPVLDNRRYGSTKNSDMSVGGKSYREAQENAKNDAIRGLDDKAHGNYVNHIKNGATPVTALGLARKGVIAETDKDRSNAARDRMIKADADKYSSRFK